MYDGGKWQFIRTSVLSLFAGRAAMYVRAGSSGARRLHRGWSCGTHGVYPTACSVQFSAWTWAPESYSLVGPNPKGLEGEGG